MTDRNLLRAQLLIEAADLLNEAEARNTRIALSHNVKGEKSKNVAYFKGTLSKEEGAKKYEELKNTIAQIKIAIEKMPPETTGEKFLAYMRDFYTLKGFAWNMVTGLILSAITFVPINKISTDAVTDIFLGDAGKGLGKLAAMEGGSAALGFAKSYGVYRHNAKTASGEKNWNKAYIERKLAAFEKKVESTYNKYYKQSDAQEPTVESILNYEL